VQHISDDFLERYLIQTLPKSDCEVLGAHLPACPECLERLEAEIDFVTAMRGAAMALALPKRPRGTTHLARRSAGA
jgi:hypothetical protein